MKIQLNANDIHFLTNKIRMIFKKKNTFHFNPHMSNLATKIEKNYNSKDKILNMNKKDINKIMFILNLSNIIDKRKKSKKNILFSTVRLNGFEYTVRNGRDDNPIVQLNKRRSNFILNNITSQTEIKPQTKFPKYIMRYSLKEL